MIPARIRIGFASFAHGHAVTYARQMQTFDDVALVACWDENLSRGQRYATELGLHCASSLEELVERSDIDCVVVACETNRHADVACAALDAGRAVLLQKPMATTLADCDRIISAVERSGCWFSLAFQMRCDEQNQRMRQLVQSGALGNLSAIRRRHCIGALFSREFVEGETRWHVSREANRGMFMDDAIHALDWLYWMIGRRPDTVSAEIANTVTRVAPDDTGIAIYRFGDLFGEVFNSSVTLAGENTVEIYGDRGVLIQNYGDGPSTALLPAHPVSLKLYQADRSAVGWQDLGMSPPSGQGARIAGVARPFVEALRRGVPMCSARDGRVSVEMCLAAYESSGTGRRISFPYQDSTAPRA